ncbi:hypothetical protein SLNSH_13330 [Alsobacter soli]|uniref:Uncharacterized protein n=1 Tax=Alsobacter soli TaxID=2109933 RepID=A0A2T1HS63_9HYPH|nr:hypothetical protein [Alsobacter soli]PSC04477.1 hypothetical protein SLNSH_13330 [Alsobacter soli]
MSTTVKTIAACAALLIGSAGLAAAQTSPGASANAPGQEMQTKGSVKGSPGASGYAPGHEKRTKHSAKSSTGASSFAPGHETGSVKTTTKKTTH